MPTLVGRIPPLRRPHRASSASETRWLTQRRPTAGTSFARNASQSGAPETTVSFCPTHAQRAALPSHRLRPPRGLSRWPLWRVARVPFLRGMFRRKRMRTWLSYVRSSRSANRRWRSWIAFARREATLVWSTARSSSLPNHRDRRGVRRGRSGRRRLGRRGWWWRRGQWRWRQAPPHHRQPSSWTGRSPTES